MQLLVGIGNCCCCCLSSSSSSTKNRRGGGGGGGGSGGGGGGGGGGLPSHSRASQKSRASVASGDAALQHAKGCLLANLVSFSFIIGAYLSANLHPQLLDSPVFVAYISSFTGSASNLEG